MRIRKIIESIYYILNKVESADKIQILKWIYLADKYHLINYGRTITGDQYCAMKYGPVASAVKDVLELNQQIIPKNERIYVSNIIANIDKITYKRTKDATSSSFEHLSITDKKAFDFIIRKFGKMNAFQLVKYTHKYPEWKEHEQKFANNKSRVEIIKVKDLFSLLKNDFLGISEERLQTSKKIFVGKI